MSIKQSRQVSQAYIDKGNDITIGTIANWEENTRKKVKEAMKRRRRDQRKGINNPLSFYTKVYMTNVFDVCNEFMEGINK